MLLGAYRLAICILMQQDDAHEIIDDGDGDVDSNKDGGVDGAKQGRTRKHQHHFLDWVLEPWARRRDRRREAAPAKSPDGGASQVSVRTIAANLQGLSQRAQTARSWAAAVGAVFSWEKPDWTVAVLLLYTWGCVRPHFFLIYPVLVLMWMIGNQYLKIHPVDKPDELRDTHSEKIGGLFGFLGTFAFEGGTGTGSENENRKDAGDEQESVRDVVNVGEELSLEDHGEATATTAVVDEKEERAENNYFLGKVLLEVQNQTWALLNAVETMEGFVQDNCGFSDEKATTLLYGELVGVVVVGVMIGPWVPWRALFIVLGWVAVGVNHPRWRELMGIAIGPDSGARARDNNEDEEMSVGVGFGIVVDEAVFVRTVVVWEIEMLDVVGGGGRYRLFGFYDEKYLKEDSLRMARRRPTMVDTVEEVGPPEGWAFVGDWTIGGRWEYDGEMGGEFRRRPWTREVRINAR